VSSSSDKYGVPELVIKVNLSRGSSSMRKLITRFSKNEEGAALVEYGMLVGLIAVVCILAVQTLGGTINGVFGAINTALTTAGLGA
jgi:pilus assembly protein Flp/PilA